MFIVGFATAVEIAHLQDQGFEVEDAPAGCVGPSIEERGEGFLLAKPEPGPRGTRAVAIFLDAALYDIVAQLEKDKLLERNSLDVAAFVERRRHLLEQANVLRVEAEKHQYCNHKYSDGRDARYPTGNGETACICGNKWD